MNEHIDISQLSGEKKQALVCLFLAKLPKEDPRYKMRSSWWQILEKRYNRKVNTYKNDKDAFDPYFRSNGRVGHIDKPLEKRSKLLKEVYDLYGNADENVLEIAVKEIIANSLEESHSSSYISMRIAKPEIAHAIINGNNTVLTIDGVYTLGELLTIGRIVFIALGGDKGKSEVDWQTGFYAISHVVREPYDVGYEIGKRGTDYFKFDIEVDWKLDKPISKEELMAYPDTYDAPYIGLEIKRDPTQAICQLEDKKAVAIIRAVLDRNPPSIYKLKSLFPEEFMSRVLGSVKVSVPVSVDYGESIKKALEEATQEENEAPPTAEEPEEDDEPDEFSEAYKPDIGAITSGFVMTPVPIESMATLINTGKHIIFTGPPGTGKTTLAERACMEAVRTKFISGYFLTTAISDWTTFDTIGGYMPDRSGRLQFQEGVFLKGIRENKWLIIDEINRAEVDKAFGHFFTVLSGMDVDLQYKTETAGGEKNISIRHVETLGSYYDERTAAYCIGRNWRIIATMNTYDKNSLFMLSYAFMRRFAFVHIDSPTEVQYEKLVGRELTGHEDIAGIILQLVKTSPKKLGAAIVLDLISFIEISGYSGVVSGICSLIIPQYEGISLPQIKDLYRNLGLLLASAERETLMSYLCEFFDIRQAELLKVRFTEEPADAENGDLEEDTDE